jgi:hypothetical protein
VGPDNARSVVGESGEVVGIQVGLGSVGEREWEWEWVHVCRRGC